MHGLAVTPHVARNECGRHSAFDWQAIQYPGYGPSHHRRKLAEELFGWTKTVGVAGKLRYLGRARNKLWLELTFSACNLTRWAQLERPLRGRTEQTQLQMPILPHDPTLT